MKQEVELGDVFKHIKSGRVYTIAGMIDVKIDGIWTPVVTYVSMEDSDDDRVWGRPLNNFLEKFELY